MERQWVEAEMELLSQNETVFDLSLFPHSDQPPPPKAPHPLLKQPSKSRKAEMEP